MKPRSDAKQKLDPYLELNYRRLLPKDQDARILDIGCGDGYVITYLSALGYRNIIGIERDADALARLSPPPGVTLRQMDITADDLAKETGRCDLIIMREMIYYFPRQGVSAVMRAVAGALKLGGRVIIEAFNGTLLCAQFTAAKDLGILTIYNEHSLRHLLTGAELEVERIEAQKIVLRGGLRSILYRLSRWIWITILKTIYMLESGIGGEFPTLYTKSIIAVGRKVAR
jgi:2-polyprenyl-3-methyl-5-hydroxy-6-metoxy-1,4-benzoquinol methylase